MRVVGILVSSKPAVFVTPDFFVETDIESIADNSAEASINDDVTKKKVTFRPYHPLNYKCEDFWLNIVQADEVPNPLRAALQKHENDCVESLRVNEYRYDVVLMTVTSSASGEIDAV